MASGGTLKERIKKVPRAFNLLSRNLRILICVLVCIVVFVFWNTVIRVPQRQRIQGLQQEIVTIRKTLLRLQVQASEFLTGKQAGGKVSGSASQIQSTIQALTKQLEQVNKVVLSVKNMAAVLQELLKENKGLRLLSVKNLPSQVVVQGGGGVTSIYQNRVEIIFEGDYFNTLRFLRHIEQLRWPTFFDSLDYMTEKYPIAKVTIQLHTLSQAEASGS